MRLKFLVILMVCLFARGQSAFADAYKGFDPDQNEEYGDCYPGSDDEDCDAKNHGPGYPEDEPPLVFPSPEPAPVDGGICLGNFQGYYSYSPNSVSITIEPIDMEGHIRVSGWWMGYVYYGRGTCRPEGPFKAKVRFQFDGSPDAHRGYIFNNGDVSWMEGQLGGFAGFKLHRIH